MSVLTCNILQHTMIMLRSSVQNGASKTKEEMGIGMESETFASGEGKMFHDLIVETQIYHGIEYARKGPVSGLGLEVGLGSGSRLGVGVGWESGVALCRLIGVLFGVLMVPRFGCAKQAQYIEITAGVISQSFSFTIAGDGRWLQVCVRVRVRKS